MNQLAIRLKDISVCYQIPTEPIGSFKEYAIRFLQGKINNKDFWALSKVSLDIYSGETLGIIGNNGAGKSTLLKVISRILPPTTGRLQVSGFVTPLMEIGAGFHPELTGRENVFLNGTLLGHARDEIIELLDEIQDFAEIGNFIDAPLRTYSSGMVARLGFAVATAWKPEILILDEVLTVGDHAFRQKCQLRMEEFQKQGVTILVVSHDIESVRSLCQRAAYLEKGELRFVGQINQAISYYLENQILR